MEAGLAAVSGKLGREYDMIVGGRRLKTKGKITSVNPARPKQVIGVHQRAEAEDAEAAVQAALTAFSTWSKVPVTERAELLLKAAALIRERKFEYCAWLTFEVGKNWAEADADVGETIDFLEFYAREALKLEGAETPIQLPGERNRLRYVPPWRRSGDSALEFSARNYGRHDRGGHRVRNTVVLKPSVDAPTIAAIFMALLEEAGLPEGVVNFCPGEGPGFGSALVAHPNVRFISFTGSKAVGLEIHESAAKARPGQIFIKRTVLEMGGKDAIIVAADADLEAAVEGVATSAFGFNGQKCSACSRAIVDGSIYDAFVERLQARVDTIKGRRSRRKLLRGSGDLRESVCTRVKLSGGCERGGAC